MGHERHDLRPPVVGGGINGAGIARDAAGRGLSVLLVERDDLAAHTSSWSTKLIHGGLRYLEHYEFRLVAESLAEREVLLRLAPHIIQPLAFVLPHEPHLRPAWMIRAGLFLYDRLGGRMTLPKSFGVDARGQSLGRRACSRGFARLRLLRCARRRRAARGRQRDVGARAGRARSACARGSSGARAKAACGARRCEAPRRHARRSRARAIVNAGGPVGEGRAATACRHDAVARATCAT